MMMESLSDSYAIKGQLIRHEIRMAENTRQIETERKRRFGKGQGVNKQSMPVFCAMCDTQFTNTTLTLHRHSSGHLRLKRFLHPKCISCDEEFPTRIDWDEHLLSTNHIKKISELGIIKLSSEDDELKDYIEQGEDAGIDMQKYTTISVQETDNIEKQDTEAPEGAEKLGKPDNLKDFIEGSDLSGCTLADLPKYDPKTPVGMSFIKEIPCYSCTICHHFMATCEAAAVHMKSLKHYESFMKIMKKQIVSAQQKETKQEASEDTNANDTEDGAESKEENTINLTEGDEHNVAISEVSNENSESKTRVVGHEQVEQKEEKIEEQNSTATEAIQVKKEEVTNVANTPVQNNSNQTNDATTVKEEPKPETESEVTTPAGDSKQNPNQNSLINKTATPNTRANTATRGRGSNRARRGTPRRY